MIRSTIAPSVALAMAIALGSTGCVTTGSPRGSYEERTLANGMRVIVKEDHRAPVAVSQVWYRVGSVDEPEGTTGVSHVLEHMMFKGTKRLKPGEFSRIIAENGGRENAFTNDDYTAYFQQLEVSRLPLAFELEADRMQNLVVLDEEFRKEIKVVQEERRWRTDDQPNAQVYERLAETAFRVSPYHHPVIGWMRDLESMKGRDVSDWYRRWYGPDNATLVVVGDIQPGDIFAAAEKHFGALPARGVVHAPLPVEPPQMGERRARVQAPAEVPVLVLGFHVPVLSADGSTDREAFALSVAAGVLDGGQAARFEKKLIRTERIASSTGVDYSPVARAATLFVIQATPAQGRTVKEVEGALMSELARLANELVPADELARVKAQVAAQSVYARDSTFYQAMKIGQLAVVGLDPGLADEWVARIDAVTPEEIRAVTRKYLHANNMTAAWLDPLPIDPNQKPRAAPAGGAHGR